MTYVLAAVRLETAGSSTKTASGGLSEGGNGGGQDVGPAGSSVQVL